MLRFHFTLVRALSPFVLLGALATSTQAQVTLPEVVVSAPSPIQRSGPPSTTGSDLQGTLPVVTDQFATVTVVPNDEIRRNGATTLGDLLFSKPGITGSSFAPGGSSRPIIRGLDVNRVRIQEDGIGANGASDLGEDHFVPVDPLTTDQVEVIRGPATLRFGSQAIGGVVETTNNRIPTVIPPRGIGAEFRGAGTSVDNGIDGAVLLDAGAGNFAMHADAFGRKTQDYRVPNYPYLTAPDPADAPNATQPGAFNGRQPNSAARNDGQALGGSYIFNEGFFGLAVTQNNALYHIPGIDGEDHAHPHRRASDQGARPRANGARPIPFIDAIRFWGGVTDYKHNEIGLADPTDLTSDGIRQTFTNKEQEGRVEAQLAPFNLRFAALTTAHRRAGRPSGAHRAEPRRSPACGTRTRTTASPVTCSTSSSSARRPRRRSPAASNRSICPALAALFHPTPRRLDVVDAGLARLTRRRARASA